MLIDLPLRRLPACTVACTIETNPLGQFRTTVSQVTR
jgi:hypothetical protein